MKTLKTMIGLAVVAAVWAIFPRGEMRAAGAKAEKATLRVGVFDSRAVAVAYAGSEEFSRGLRKMKDEYDKAEAAGDTQKMEQLKEAGKTGQQRAHEQVFSTATVGNILAEIKDQLPAIAQKAGVDVIVSKWDIVYQVPGTEFVDVTRLLVEPLHPSEKALRTIKELEKHAPIPLEEARNIKD